MMVEDPYTKFTCSFRAGDGAAESGSGIIVQIGREDLQHLLEEPSCLKTKVGEKLSADETYYALITAHSCVYAPDAPDKHALELAGRKIVVGNSDNKFEIPIEDCSCAVSCCGMDSIMRLTKEKNDFALMPHTRECHIGFDFLILFLKADAVNKKKPKGYPDPPTFSLDQCQQFPTTSPFNTSMYWCSGGMVRKAEKIISPSMKQDTSAPEVQRLRDEVDSFLAKRSCAYQPHVNQIGAPVVLCTESSSCLIGISIGEKLTTVHGMVELLKGGLIPFLAVMRHSSARLLRTSKWKEHVLPHLRSENKFTPRSMWDLLHHLLEKRNFRILQIDPGHSLMDIVSGFEILTAVFDNLKTRSDVPFDDYHLDSDGEVCTCMNILYSRNGFITSFSKLFADNPENKFAIKMVEALFQCFQSMLNWESMAVKLLSENIEHLIKIATSQLYASNDVVNNCFKTIILKERAHLIEELEHYRRYEQRSMSVYEGEDHSESFQSHSEIFMRLQPESELAEVRHQHSVANRMPNELKEEVHRKDVYKQRQFTYTGKEDRLLWEEYGIELYFPSHTSTVNIEGTVSVLSTDRSNYIFPEGCELVSAVYDVSTNEPFPEPVTVRLQHCVPIESEDTASEMSFVIADTAKGPPYKFQPLSGGSFTRGSSYAEVQLTHFCMLALVVRLYKWLLGHPVPFSARVYYLQNSMVTFVVTKNLDSHITAVMETFSELNIIVEGVDDFPIRIDRHSPAVGLKVPSNTSWEITPLVSPAEINMDVISDYHPGRAIPQVKMELNRRQQGEGQPVHERVIVELTGVHDPSWFYLRCTHEETDRVVPPAPPPHPQPPTPALDQRPTLSQLRLLGSSSGQRVEIIATTAANWEDLGILMNFDETGCTIERIAREHPLRPIDCCTQMMREWLEGRGRQPATWATLINMLKDAAKNDLAQQLEKIIVGGESRVVDI